MTPLNYKQTAKTIKSSLLGLMLSLLLCISYVHAEPLQLRVLTEESPFTMHSEQPSSDNETPISGEATLFVDRVLQRANITHQTEFIPWKRAYQISSQRPNTLLYPVARTMQREANFHWVGSISPIRYFFFKLKSRPDISLNQLSDANNYNIGVVNKHANHEYLVSRGFKQFETVNSNAQNLKKLLLGRIDIMPMSSSGLAPLCDQINADCSLIVPALALDDFSDGLYMVLSKDSDKSLVEAIQKSYLEEIKTERHWRLFERRTEGARKIEQQL